MYLLSTLSSVYPHSRCLADKLQNINITQALH